MTVMGSFQLRNSVILSFYFMCPEFINETNESEEKNSQIQIMQS